MLRLILSGVALDVYIRRLLWVIYRVESLGRKSGRYMLCSVCKFGGLLRCGTLILKQTSCGNSRYILIKKLGFIKSGRLPDVIQYSEFAFRKIGRASCRERV